MRRVSPGEPLRISAMDWNRIAELVDSEGLSQTRKPYQGSNSPCIVLGCNQTGSRIEMGMALSLGGLQITPSNNESDFISGSVYNLYQTGNGIIGVALQPIESGEIGPVAVSGHVPVMVNVSDTTHQYATPGSNGYLDSAPDGPVRLSYTNPSLGRGWCNALLAPPAATPTPTPAASYAGPFALYSNGDLPTTSIYQNQGICHAGSVNISCSARTLSPGTLGWHYVRLNVTWTGRSENYYSYSYDNGTTETFSYTTWQKVIGRYHSTGSAIDAIEQWWMGGNLDIPGRVL